MKKKYKISVIVPYFNEQKKIIKTLNNLKKQTYKNFDVILINSNSSDDSFNVVNEWIKNNRRKHKIQFKNYNKKTFYPSTSKNAGIKCSKNAWVAFMDCDLKFSKNWLQDQVEYLKKNKTMYVMGLCHFTGYDMMDKIYVSQTWGYNSKIAVIPSSIFHKSLFKKIGYFQETRAGYDKIWKQNLKKKDNGLKINYKCLIKYEKYNHANNFEHFLKKIFRYSISSFKVKNNNQPKIYFLIFILFIIISSKSFYYFISILLFYLFLRSYFYPIFKSKTFNLNFSSIIFLPIVGVSIDIVRFFAYCLCLIRLR